MDSDSPKVGRPSKYKEEYCDQIVEFFNQQPYTLVEIDQEDEDGNVTKTVAVDKFGNAIKVPCPLPTKERFAFNIGIHRETLINWAQAHPKFFDAIKKAEDLQKDILIQNGLVQAYDKTFAIFVAKNVTDMRDRQDINTNLNVSSADSWSDDVDS